MSITSANSVYTLTVDTIFNQPQQLQKYAVDDAFTTQVLNAGEVQMGVDGGMAGGFVYVPVVQEIVFIADSPSVALFDQWYNAQLQAKDVYVASGTIIMPSIRTKWAMTFGILVNYSVIPDAKKVLQFRRFGITWQSAIPSPV